MSAPPLLLLALALAAAPAPRAPAPPAAPSAAPPSLSPSSSSSSSSSSSPSSSSSSSSSPAHIALLPPRVVGVAAPFDAVVQAALTKSGAGVLGWRAVPITLAPACDPLEQPACLAAALVDTGRIAELGAVAQLLADRSGDKLGVRLRVFGVDGVIKDEQRLEAPIDGAGAASDALLVAAFARAPPEPKPPVAEPPVDAALADAAAAPVDPIVGVVTSVVGTLAGALLVVAGTVGLIVVAISEPEWGRRARGQTFPQNSDDPLCGGAESPETACVAGEEQNGWTRGYGPTGVRDQVGQGARFMMVAISRDNELSYEEGAGQAMACVVGGAALTVAAAVGIAYFGLPAADETAAAADAHASPADEAAP